MTINEAIAVCKTLVTDHPELVAVIRRIKDLCKERDRLYRKVRNPSDADDQ